VDAIDEEVVQTVRGLAGVARVQFLESEARRELRELGTAGAAENRGVLEVLSRSRVLCLFKDATFRPPPEPTLLLVDDAGTVLGREILPGDRAPADRRVAHLGKDFVLYAGARPRGSYRFLLPAVRFPELEANRNLARVVSASPDTPQDEYLRTHFGVPVGREYASILVGYEVRNP
jgi:hypothetical protein